MMQGAARGKFQHVHGFGSGVASRADPECQTISIWCKSEVSFGTVTKRSGLAQHLFLPPDIEDGQAVVPAGTQPAAIGTEAKPALMALPAGQRPRPLTIGQPVQINRVAVPSKGEVFEIRREGQIQVPARQLELNPAGAQVEQRQAGDSFVAQVEGGRNMGGGGETGKIFEATARESAPARGARMGHGLAGQFGPGVLQRRLFDHGFPMPVPCEKRSHASDTQCAQHRRPRGTPPAPEPKPFRRRHGPGEDRFAAEEMFEIFCQFNGGGIAALRFFLQAFEADGFEVGIYDLRFTIYAPLAPPARKS